MSRFVVGIDVGGTNIKMGLVDPGGKLVSRTDLATRTFMRSQKELLKAILEGSQDLIKKNRLQKKEICNIGYLEMLNFFTKN